MKKSLLLWVICALLVSVTAKVGGQVPDDVNGRLYMTCKTWGYFKYFSQHKCELKWDTLLNTTVEEVLLAGSNAEFNEAIMAMLNKVGNNSYVPIPSPEPDTNINLNSSWIDDPIFSQPVQDFLENFANNIYPDASICLVRYNDWTDPTYHSWIDFRNDGLTLPGNYSNESYRLTVMFYYWNVINYFFPYKSITDQPWDSTLMEIIPVVRQAETDFDFHVSLLRMATRINDSHALMTVSDLIRNEFWGGNYMPRIYFTRVDTMCVVTKVDNIPGVSPGDVLVALKGIPIGELEDSLAGYIPASTPAGLYKDMYFQMLRGNYGTHIQLTLRDKDDNINEVVTDRILPRMSWFTWYRDTGANTSYFMTACDYGYVNMGMLQSDEVPDMFAAFEDTPAIIFDLRYNPNGTLWDIAPLLFAWPPTSAVYYDPAMSSPGSGRHYLPGWYYQEDDHDNLGSWLNPHPYNGEVIILVNQETMSQGEYTCQYLSCHENSKVIGTQTAGADGNISYLILPGDLETWFTSLGWYYYDGYQQQRNGVKIDTVVSPTIEGIREGRDEILLAALDCLVSVDQVAAGQDKLLIYPNPASSVLRIRMTVPDHERIELCVVDLAGRTVLQQVSTCEPGTNDLSLDVSSLSSGVYNLKALSEDRITNARFIVK
jgi:C-terminal processing protease CtpA/Prc